MKRRDSHSGNDDFGEGANDEYDYGSGLALGMDLFRCGSPSFQIVAGRLLFLVYNLLKRNLFGDIPEDHLAKRSKEIMDQRTA